jgi:hypothetical protein
MNYDINIRFEQNKDEKFKEEIWADIYNPIKDEFIKKLIWYKDENGLIHDESSNLPIKFRDIVDNAWISAIKNL